MKNYFPYKDDAAMQYEELAKAAFNCGRSGDLWGYADADFYPAFHKPDLKARRALSTILICLTLNPAYNKITEELIKLEDKVWKKTNDTREKMNLIINQTIKLLENTEVANPKDFRINKNR